MPGCGLGTNPTSDTSNPAVDGPLWPRRPGGATDLGPRLALADRVRHHHPGAGPAAKSPTSNYDTAAVPAPRTGSAPGLVPVDSAWRPGGTGMIR